MAIGADPTRLYRGQGIVYIADRDAAGKPTGFIDLGNCTALSLSPTIERIEHQESRTGRNFKDAYIERQTQVSGTMTLESTAKENLMRYFYGTTTAVAGATILNEVVKGYKGKEMSLEQINITTFTSLTSADGLTTYTRDLGKDPNVYISFFDSSTNTFTANAHGLANGTRVWVDADTLPAGFIASSNYYVINTATNTFQLSASPNGSAIDGTSAGSGIVVTVQYDYKVELRTGVIQFYPGASFAEGESLCANYTAGSSEITYAFTSRNRDVAFLFTGLNTAENDSPVKVKVFKARLDPVQQWNLINEEFNQFEIGFECLYDNLQPKFTGRFFTEEQLRQFKTVFTGNQNGIFGYGYTNANVSITNLVSNTGVVATDTTGVGTARGYLAACEYGLDKGIFGYGITSVNVSNLVSNTGVVATDTTGVGTARWGLAACGYGGDKGIFGYGYTNQPVSITNRVSDTGVVATDTTGVGTARLSLAACGYGGDKGIFGYGSTNQNVSITNLVSNTGVVATDTTGVGTARNALAACGYGGDKGIFGYGATNQNVSITNLVSNTGVVATDTTGVGTARNALAACGYGGDKGIFGYGATNQNVSITNLVSNTGVVATDTTGVGTARNALAACSFGL